MKIGASTTTGFPTLLAATGLTVVGILLVALLTVAMVIGAVWAPNTRGRTLKEIEIERYGSPVTDDVSTGAVAALDTTGGKR